MEDQNLISYDIGDPNFISDLQESKKAVWKATKWLSEKGYNVIVKPTFVRPDVSEMDEYSDIGDLEIVQRVEVKRRPNIDFKSKDDFPYQTVIVDVSHAWDNARPKPFAYLIFNSSLTGCLVILGNTNEKWSKVTKFDNGKNRLRTFYECPLELCKYFSV